MKKSNYVLREILHRVYERGEPFMSQKSLAETCDLSSETVNRHVSRLHRFHAIEKRPQGFRVVNSRKILQYWAATRDLHDDIVWSTYSASSMDEMESDLPEGSVLTAYSGYRRRFGDVPVPYRRVYAYSSLKEVRRRFSGSGTGEGNLVILRTDPHLQSLSEGRAAPPAQLYVDLWQIGTSTADRYRQKLEEELEPKPLELLKDLTRRTP